MLTVRLGDLREVVLAGSLDRPVTDRHPDPLIGPWKDQILAVTLFLHTFARAWGLESIEPTHGGLKVQIILLPAPEPPVIQAAVGRAVLVLRDGEELCEAWIEPLEPSLEILQTRDHHTARGAAPRASPAVPKKRKDLLRGPTVLMNSQKPKRRSGRWAAPFGAIALGVVGAVAATQLQQASHASDLEVAWERSLIAAVLPEGVSPTIAVSGKSYGGLDGETASAAMRTLELAAGSCYLDALEAGTAPPELRGLFTARVTLRSSGTAMSVDGTNVPFQDELLADCLVEAAGSLRVRGAPGGSSLDLTVSLSPS